MLTGSARRSKEAEIKAALLRRNQKVEARGTELERRRSALEAKIAMLRAEFALHEADLQTIIDQEEAEKEQLARGGVDMGLSRKADAKPNKRKGGSK
jgi:circadian clock protein KaiC